MGSRFCPSWLPARLGEEEGWAQRQEAIGQVHRSAEPGDRETVGEQANTEQAGGGLEKPSAGFQKT